MTSPGQPELTGGDSGAAVVHLITNLANDPSAVGQIHQAADKNASQMALHHTLGQEHNMASPGDHKHTGRDSAKLTATSVFIPPVGGADGVLLVGNTLGWFQSPAHSAGDRLIAKPGVGAGLQWSVSPGCLMPVRTVSTANQTIATPGTPSTDGVAWASGDRVLLAGQSTASQNGVYLYTGSGNALIRTTDADLAQTLAGGVLIPVLSGTIYAGTTWQHTTTGAITLGSTSLTFARRSKLFTQFPFTLDVVANVGPSSGTTALTLATTGSIAMDGLTKIRAEFEWPRLDITVNTDVFAAGIAVDGTAQHQIRINTGVTVLGGSSVRWESSTAPTAGNHTFSAFLVRTTGTGTGTITCGAAPSQGQFVVHEI